MRQIFILTLLIFLTGMSAATAQPKLEILGGNTYNWGKVSLDKSPLKTNITIKNSGTALLKISRVKPACGCTTAPLDKTDLQPGETATMNITLNLGKAGGPMQKAVLIYSNDPYNDLTTLMLKCDIWLPLRLSKKFFGLNMMTVGVEKSVKITLTNQTQKTVTLSNVRVTPDSGRLNIRGKKKLKPGQTINLTLSATAVKPGNTKWTVLIETDCPGQKELKIIGIGRIKK
ncbi:MAG: DUF1573 domain-containing protein [Candidatus Kapabacteria bacterium]|nr:DUF1573 domain-containing protein [Candidatus Kapabacteria bacterium]